MAVTSTIYPHALKHLQLGAINLEEHDIRVALLKASYSPGAHEYWSNVSTHEVSGTGYQAGGKSLANKSVTVNTTTRVATFDADDVNWANSTITARYAVIYNNTPTQSSQKQLICLIDFGEDKVSANGNFTIEWDANGIFRLTTV